MTPCTNRTTKSQLVGGMLRTLHSSLIWFIAVPQKRRVWYSMRVSQKSYSMTMELRGDAQNFCYSLGSFPLAILPRLCFRPLPSLRPDSGRALPRPLPPHPTLPRPRLWASVASPIPAPIKERTGERALPPSSTDPLYISCVPTVWFNTLEEESGGVVLPSSIVAGTAVALQRNIWGYVGRWATTQRSSNIEHWDPSENYASKDRDDAMLIG